MLVGDLRQHLNLRPSRAAASYRPGVPRSPSSARSARRRASTRTDVMKVPGPVRRVRSPPGRREWLPGTRGSRSGRVLDGQFVISLTPIAGA